jgi:Zn-dependent protease with chaperone function
MSEMTATRMAVGATVAAAWLLVAWWLWQTEVPGGLALPSLSADAVFGRARVEANEHYVRVLRLLFVGALAAQLAALVLVASRRAAVGRRLRGPAVVRAGLLGALVALAAWLAALPFGLASLWWRRREGVARAGYGRWLADQLLPLAAELALAAVAAAALLLVARRLGRRWWLAAWAALSLLAAGWLLLAPALLAPRLEPLHDRALTAEIQRLARLEGLGDVRVEVRQARTRTRAVNAEAIGVWPTTTVVLWDTLLEPQVGRGEIRFVVAHELAHVARHHVEKGVAWFVLLALPCAWALSRVTSMRRPEDVPLAALAAALTALAFAPLALAISRRYEREADWVALRVTGDPAGAEAAFGRFTRTSHADPDPPRLWHLLAGTHPTLLERVELSRAAALRAGPGSP